MPSIATSSSPVRARSSKARAGLSLPSLPPFIAPQLCRPVAAAPNGPEWAHEIKLDGYRMHVRIDRGRVQLLTRTGLDWTDKYPAACEALRTIRADGLYIDGELCGVRPNGTTSFSMMQAATDGAGMPLVFFAFDLIYVHGEDISASPLIERKERLRTILAGASDGVRFSDHMIGDGELFRRHAAKLELEGVVSKRVDRPYAPGNRGLWVKTKCLNREEFVVVGWSDPEGGREALGSLLLGYYAPDGRLVYAGRVGSGMTDAELRKLQARLAPLATPRMSVDVPPPRTTRYGTRRELSAVHWIGRSSSSRSPT